VEKTRGDGPSLLSTPPSRAHPLNRWLVGAVLALLVVNAAVLGVWLAGSHVASPVEQRHSPPPGPSTPAAPDPGVASRAESMAQNAYVEPVRSLADTATALPETVIAPPSAETRADQETVIAPVGAMAQAIEISTHVYSEDPELRAVTIDGRRLREGDEIRRGVRLVEITESGIVIDADGVRSEMDVLQDWR
jgi:general secretion pathway protein B